MTSTSTPITVTILAANGQQSSAIISHLKSLDSGFRHRFRVRAVVRDPSRYAESNVPDERSAAVGTKRVVDEVVAGDMTNVASLKKAFEATDVLWAMTNPDPTRGMDAEIEHGRNIVDAFLHSIKGRADAVHKPLLLYSSCIDVDSITKGELRMVNATAKARVESYIHSLPQSELQTFLFTFVHAGMFMQNFTTYQKPTIDQGGVFHFVGAVRPDVQIPFVDITDLGPLVWQLIETAFPPEGKSTVFTYDSYDRATVRLWGELLSYPQLVEQFTRATGKAAKYDYLSVAKFLSETFGCTEEAAKAKMNSRDRTVEEETMVTMIGDMYNLINRYGYYADGFEAFDDTRQDVRRQKIVDQQPTRRTSWKAFAQASFANEQTAHSRSSGSDLSVPPNFPETTELSAAQSVLYRWFSYYLAGSKDDSDRPSDFEQEILPLFHPNAVVELPYFPMAMRQGMGLKPLSSGAGADGAILEGRAEILNYFKDWRKLFWFEKGELQSLSALTSSSRHQFSAVEGAVAEVRLTGRVSHGGNTKPYVQDYVTFVYVDDHGYVTRYQEYWAADRFV